MLLCYLVTIVGMQFDGWASGKQVEQRMEMMGEQVKEQVEEQMEKKELMVEKQGKKHVK